ncbi:MAG: hemolysin III family protein [Paracoccaceae bacterium]
MRTLSTRTGYSAAERRSDLVVHLAGLAAVALAVPALIGVTLLSRGDGLSLVATGIYAATLTATILFSALYNTVGQRRWTGALRRLDHSAIYAKIAGTYTPFLLMSDGHTGLLAGLWTAAAAGIGLKLASPERLRSLALALCIGMGWTGIVAGGFLTAMSGPVVALILTGGALYTLGIAFYLFDRLPFHYTIWHVFVLAASMTFYAAVTLQVTQAGMS